MQVIVLAAFAATAAASPLVTRVTDAPNGNKKGLAYNNGTVTNILYQNNSASWAYNWGTAKNAPKYQQIPMYWGPGSSGDSAGVLASVTAGTPWVLGYNEPDETYGNGGCQQTPQQAYAAWSTDMFKFADKGAKLVCPAISSWDTTSGHTGGPAGLTWLRQFASIPTSPSTLRCGAQALHWYGATGQTAAQQAQGFIDYVAYAKTQVDAIFKTSMDLWITEFSPLPVGDAQVLSDFLKVVIPWLDAQSYVARYSPFMAENMVANGALNAAGKTFVSTA